jgi:hypothetical protein
LLLAVVVVVIQLAVEAALVVYLLAMQVSL